MTNPYLTFVAGALTGGLFAFIAGYLLACLLAVGSHTDRCADCYFARSRADRQSDLEENHD